MFDEEEIISDYRDSFTENFETHFDVVADKVLMGKRLDVYSVLKAKIEDNQKAIKALSLLYPIPLIKGYPEDIAREFFEKNNRIGYGFWYSPFGYITNNMDA